jgi:hypothetical protein
VINTPDIGPQYFREVAAIVNAGGPPDRAKLTATMQRFGLLAAPPECSRNSRKDGVPSIRAAPLFHRRKMRRLAA